MSQNLVRKWCKPHSLPLQLQCVTLVFCKIMNRKYHTQSLLIQFQKPICSLTKQPTWANLLQIHLSPITAIVIHGPDSNQIASHKQNPKTKQPPQLHIWLIIQIHHLKLIQKSNPTSTTFSNSKLVVEKTKFCVVLGEGTKIHRQLWRQRLPAKV